ncbi:MAG TPA: glycoside hydrolase family 3 C-terminal domain-containing protein [Bacteroidales bacterium]|nr:glycoside hydrolase family 3 C-terminal domain-containing protein [Bacteroidales bacterium]
MKKLFLLVCTFIPICVLAQNNDSFRNPKLEDEKRIDNLISQLTVDEKINCLSSGFEIPRLGIRNSGNSEGLHGLSQGGPGYGQKVRTPTTQFPQSIGLAQTWDEDLIRQVAEEQAMEARYIYQSPKYYKAGLVVWGPNADLGRDPRWGRTEECFGEDPFLTSQLVTAFVKGMQGDNPRYWLVASLMKHFLSNSNENGRTFTSSNYDDVLFREYYSYPFYKGVTDGGSRAYMAAYNSYNGIPCTVHPMLKNITIDQWGQNGIITTDGGAFRLLVTDHKYFKTYAETASACIHAGINMFLDDYKPAVRDALKQKLISEKDLDLVIRGRFRVLLKLGLLDDNSPYKTIGVNDTIDPWTKSEVQAMVRKITAKSVVLLKNEHALLPLDKQKLKSVALIGPFANQVLQDWYAGGLPYQVSILQGLRNALGDDVKITWVRSNKIDSAYLAAKNSDVAIVCIGNHPTGNAGWEQAPVASDGKEAVDRQSLSLELEDLAKVVYSANPKTILLLTSSFPFTINWSQEHLPAILQVAHGSQEMGNGVADVLFGNLNPAGRLVQTWPRSMEDLPPMLDYDIRHGRTYMYSQKTPLYPFGFGLSYTTFRYSNIQLNLPSIDQKGKITVSMDVNNTGKMDGEEVIQLYIKGVDGIQRLKGFKRVNIAKGESQNVKIELKGDDLATWDAISNKFKIKPGVVELLVGASSSDIRLRTKLKLVS